MKQFAIAALFMSMVVGCASTTDTNAPTHRWASTAPVDRIQYLNDHARCQASAGIAESRAALDTSSERFQEYKMCMNSSGYELIAYSDN